MQQFGKHIRANLNKLFSLIKVRIQMKLFMSKHTVANPHRSIQSPLNSTFVCLTRQTFVMGYTLHCIRNKFECVLINEFSILLQMSENSLGFDCWVSY